MLEIIQMIEWFSTEIRYQARDLKESVKLASGHQSFSHLSFLNECVDLLEQLPFPQAWNRSIDGWKNSLEEGDILQLKLLSGILGACDVDGQLTALERVQLEFQHRLEVTATQVATKGRMFRSLGLLGGLAVAVIAI